MNNHVIKSEDIIDLTDSDIFLNVKKEEIENDCIFVDEDVELLEVIPVKTEKIQERGNFETIFLPEVYTGVAVETPFFDIISYKRRYDRSAEDVDTNKSNVYTNLNTNNNSVYQYIEIEGADGYYSYGTCKNVLIDDSDGTEYTYVNSKSNVCVPQNNNGMQRIPHENGYNYRTPLNNMYQHNSSTNIINQCGNNPLQTSLRRKFNSVMHVDNLLVKSELRQHRQLQSKKECQSASSSNSSNSNSKLCDEQATYKCPICKVPKSFYTLLAVNNHLKFSHISLFSNRKKLIEAVNEHCN